MAMITTSKTKANGSRKTCMQRAAQNNNERVSVSHYEWQHLSRGRNTLLCSQLSTRWKQRAVNGTPEQRQQQGRWEQKDTERVSHYGFSTARYRLVIKFTSLLRVSSLHGVSSGRFRWDNRGNCRHASISWEWMIDCLSGRRGI